MAVSNFLSDRSRRAIAAFLMYIGGAAFLLPLTFNSVNAGAEEAQRLAADIVVMLGDLRRLSDGDLLVRHQQGLKERIEGVLAYMPLAVRSAESNFPDLKPLPENSIERLRNSWAAGDLNAMRVNLTQLTGRFPFSSANLMPPDQRAAAKNMARQLHENYCAACHDDPDLEVSRPAWSLYNLAKSMEHEEFAARLYVGVRGEQMMAMENPLKDTEMSALIALYKNDYENVD